MTEEHPARQSLVFLAVVDDNTFFRDWLGQAGTLAPHHHVVLRAGDAAQLAAGLEGLPDRRCDVILLDLRVVQVGDTAATEVPVQGRGAVELALRTASVAVAEGRLERAPGVLVYTQESATRVHLECLLAGASGVVHKSEPLSRLVESIDVVADGGLVVGDRLATLIEHLAGREAMELTETEAVVLALAGHGHTRQQIATRVGSTESTVDKHLRAVRDKFGDRIPLADLADDFGLRDLAPPRSLAASVRRARTRSLAERLRRPHG